MRLKAFFLDIAKFLRFLICREQPEIPHITFLCVEKPLSYSIHELSDFLVSDSEWVTDSSTPESQLRAMWTATEYE